ncbi:HAD-like domain-containing protein [Halenospora varia]|nr:HAD-like domain-containing protein [Halenospora varia]
MAESKEIVIAFDLYDTLLSTESIAKELAKHFGDEKAQSVAALWRRFQLEYTWRMNSMGLYEPFSTITDLSLNHALAESSLTLSQSSISSLMHAYDSLGTFPDVPPALNSISSSPNITAYVFSNGTNAMVLSSVNQSPSLSPFKDVFKDLITVEEVRRFKPDPKVYEYLVEKVGKRKEEKGEVWLVSGNPFDVVGARAYGIQACWISRVGHHDAGGWNDKLGEAVGSGVRPTVIAGGVDDAVKKIVEWTEKNGKGSKAESEA